MKFNSKAERNKALCKLWVERPDMTKEQLADELCMSVRLLGQVAHQLGLPRRKAGPKCSGNS